jgi:hypothetical protein
MRTMNAVAATPLVPGLPAPTQSGRKQTIFYCLEGGGHKKKVLVKRPAWLGQLKLKAKLSSGTTIKGAASLESLDRVCLSGPVA